MKRIKIRQPSLNVYSSPREAYYPPVIKNEMISGPKPRGWNLKKSNYRVTLKIVYLIKYNDEIRGRRIFNHTFVIKNSRFSGSKNPGNLLEGRIVEEIANRRLQYEKKDRDIITPTLGYREWIDTDDRGKEESSGIKVERLYEI